jgi:hypothetical protein
MLNAYLDLFLLFLFFNFQNNIVQIGSILNRFSKKGVLVGLSSFHLQLISRKNLNPVTSGGHFAKNIKN